MADFRLLPLLELAQRRLDAATAELQQLAARRQEAESKLAQLRGFLHEYRASLEEGLVTGMELDRVRDFHAFLAKIERAIGLQSAEVERARATWESANERWLALRRDEQALSVLRQRHAAAETLREARRDQKRQDEFAARRHWQELPDEPSSR